MIQSGVAVTKFRMVAQCWAAILCLVLPAVGNALVIQVQDPAGNPVFGFRWQVEEDTTHAVNPGVRESDILSFSIHRSYAPVARNGSSASFQADTDAAPFGPLPTDKRYYVSVLPNQGYSLGGKNVEAGQDTVTVVVHPHPIPAAQITILAFRDDKPINNEPDIPQEVPNPADPSDPGMAGFTIQVSDIALRLHNDVFSNPLGTTYLRVDGQIQYDADGAPIIDVLGDGIIVTDFYGSATVKNIAPGMYGVRVIPPSGSDWVQTSTIEGTPGIDAWVKANEPPFFAEFGNPGVHVFVGFVKPMNNLPAPAPGADVRTVIGRITTIHNSRPPIYTFYDGAPVEECWIGLNDLATGVAGGTGIYAAACAPDGTFEIPNVPPGSYQLVAWDKPLDSIFGIFGLTVPAGGSGTLDLGDVQVFRWFSTIDNYVFWDSDEDGFPDAGEPGMPLQNVNLRYRDGSMYKFAPSNLTGNASFGEVFPFFHWQVAEVDSTRFKSTGVTVVVDGGGAPASDPVLQAWTGSPETEPKLTPQVQPENGGLGYRTQAGPVLTQAFQHFLGSTSRIYWGKSLYGPGENGGISGMVYYATTRAENDPRFAVGDGWEPGIPRVQLALYRDSDADGQIDDLNTPPDGIQLADVDNHPFGNFPGEEDVDRNANGFFDGGDAISITTSDSWDDNMPAGCPGEPGTQAPFYIHGDPANTAQECFEGLRTFNQVRPGVFDGTYNFSSYTPGGIDSGNAPQSLPNGSYIVEAAPPPFFQTVEAEDKNVDFGDSFAPSPLLAPPVCVGEDRLVPDFLTLFPAIDAPFAGQVMSACDRKQVSISGLGMNAAANFFMFTEVPKAGRVVGFILDDLSNEFDPSSPQFGEKFAPAWMPISLRDWAGVEVSRLYSDEFGHYNTMLPSTYSVNIPSPSGVSHSMMTMCLNHPGPIPDPADPTRLIMDPFYNPSYSQFCYTFQFLPGTTRRYADTPVLPIAAHTGPNQFPLDCEEAPGIPMVHQVDGPFGGPYVSMADGSQAITILASGDTDVRNPAYDPIGAPSEPRLIARDYGFGDVAGTITVGGVPIPSAMVSWSNSSITAYVPSFISTGQLLVTRGDNGNVSPIGITLTVGGAVSLVGSGDSIQQAIDAAPSGSTVIVLPGIYEQNPIVWKDIKLQGSGVGSTILNSFNNPAEKILVWRNKIQALFDAGDIQLLPGQQAPGGASPVEPERGMVTEEAPGVTVFVRDGVLGPVSSARVDGFSISGADNGGGIFVNGYARNLEISNNRILGNQGALGGGIRIGFPNLADPAGGVTDGHNDDIRIHHNQIMQNGGLQGAGGIALYNGTDRYEIRENRICGNFSAADGGGIGHEGLSDAGIISDNEILFNEAWNNTLTGSGGGILVSGAATGGSGSVRIANNRIQGNSAGTGDGGGIRAEFVNGVEALASPLAPAIWNQLTIENNQIVNNVSGLAGAVSLQDAARVRIVHNTIANNDSTATAALAFSGNASQSNPQPAGVVSHAHSPALAAVVGAGVGREYSSFSNPLLANNIIWHNRSFYWSAPVGSQIGSLLPDLPGGDLPVYDDLAVLGTALPESLEPVSCLLSDASAYPGAGNTSGDPAFTAEYVNGARSLLVQGETTAISTAITFDEAGNFVDISYGPLTLWDPATGELFGDYHLSGLTSSAAEAGDSSFAVGALALDMDGDPRPAGVASDIGADELVASVGGGGGGGTGSCGLGFELVGLLPLAMWLRRRRVQARR